MSVIERTLYAIKKRVPPGLFRRLQPPYHFLLAFLAALVYGFPSRRLLVVGVTGTTGKTTTVYLAAKMLTEAGFKTGFTSTAVINDGRREWLNDRKMTMPGRFYVQKILRRMVKAGCRFALVETTSEGVVMFRHRFIDYDYLIFTGLYPEHIEAHGSYENYKAAKGRLFEHLKRCRTKYVDESMAVQETGTDLKKLELKRIKKTIIANLDGGEADYILSFRAEEKIGYHEAGGPLPATPQNVKIVEYRIADVNGRSAALDVSGRRIVLRLLGRFNAVNAMASVCLGLAIEMAPVKMAAGLEGVAGIAGRLEAIEAGQPFAVIVDYAYEPRAVEKLYETVAHLPHDRVIHVLGSAGGGRDAARRPELGLIAGRKAGIVIVTNEDPYDEDPRLIMDQVAVGARQAGKKPDNDLFIIEDRRQAIEKALSLAREHDLVLITGKGSEQAICVAGGEKIAWDDRAVARGILADKFNR